MIVKAVTLAILCSTSASGAGLGDGSPTNISKGAPFTKLSKNEVNFAGVVTYANKQKQIEMSRLCFNNGKPEIRSVKRIPPGVSSTLDLARITSIKKLELYQEPKQPGYTGSPKLSVLVEVLFANDGSLEKRLIPYDTIISGVEPSGEKSAAYMRDINSVANIRLAPEQGKGIHPDKLIPRAVEHAIQMGKNIFGKMRTACSSAITILKKS